MENQSKCELPLTLKWKLLYEGQVCKGAQEKNYIAVPRYFHVVLNKAVPTFLKVKNKFVDENHVYDHSNQS